MSDEDFKLDRHMLHKMNKQLDYQSECIMQLEKKVDYLMQCEKQAIAQRRIDYPGINS